MLELWNLTFIMDLFTSHLKGLDILKKNSCWLMLIFLVILSLPTSLSLF